MPKCLFVASYTPEGTKCVRSAGVAKRSVDDRPPGS
jgi:hypothetical protein